MQIFNKQFQILNFQTYKLIIIGGFKRIRYFQNIQNLIHDLNQVNQVINISGNGKLENNKLEISF